ncbi:MAG: DUF4890 domain-containing protein [Prevotella sp.]|nr:DUF4890 domain-containing protein [Prevotella sp.]
MMIAIAAMMLTATTAMAQVQDNESEAGGHKPTKAEMAQRRTTMMVQKYGLNDQQAQKLLALNTEYAGKLGRGPRQHFGPKAGRGQRPPQAPQQAPDSLARKRPQQPQPTAEMQAYDTKLQAIMTPEQYQAYKTDMQQFRHRGPRGGHKGPHGKHPQQPTE